MGLLGRGEDKWGGYPGGGTAAEARPPRRLPSAALPASRAPRPDTSTVDGAIAAALLDVNERMGGAFIPPTAIDWLAPELAAAANAAHDGQIGGSRLVRVAEWRDEAHRQHVVRTLRREMYERLDANAQTLVARPTVTLHRMQPLTAVDESDAEPLTDEQAEALSGFDLIEVRLSAPVRTLP
jgi:hypothetical protein